MVQKMVVTVMLMCLIVSTSWTQDNYFIPFMHKATEPVTVDGVLDEWNFCFPIDMNQETAPANSRCQDWMPVDNIDLSGTIKVMWDEEYFYISAEIRDDLPGVLPAPGWRADAVEVYFGNYDVGNVPWDPNGDGTTPDTEEKYACQISFYFDSDNDTCDIVQYTPIQRSLKSNKSVMKGLLWDNFEGYNIEAKVAWEDFRSPNDNVFAFKGGEITPCTFSLYDVDDWDPDSDDFQGYQFAERDHPPYQGPGRGWQVMKVMPERETPYYKDSSPYLKKAKGPVTIDGNLNEWNYCFPVNMNQTSIPDYSRAYNWWPMDNIDLSGPLKFMYDENYLYIGSHIADDLPGVIPQHAHWSADAIEIYLGNYDIGEMGVVPDHSGYANSDDMLDVQLGFYYDADLDSVDIYLWNPSDKAGFLPSNDTQAAAKIWDNGLGYDYEARVSLQELADMVDEELGQRTFDFVGNVGAIFPCTYALYDRDDWTEDDFQGYQYVSDAAAPFNGPGAGGWEGVKIVPTCLYENLDHLWETYTFVADGSQPVKSSTFLLKPNYPNPFNPVTTIEFTLPRDGTVDLSIYNARGEVVKNVLSHSFLNAGIHACTVDMSHLPSGVYLSVLSYGEETQAQKMMLIK